MQTIHLPYQKNTADLFDHFVHLPHAIFLDSAGCDRFDIIAADPIKIIHNDVFESIKSELSNLAAENPYQLPFTIGAIGYLSYDIGRTCETIPTIAKHDISLPEAMIGIYDWSIVVDHLHQKTYFTSARTPKKTNVLLSLIKKKKHKQAIFKIRKTFKSNMTPAAYRSAFETIKKNILDGNCYQVNLAQRFSSVYEGNPWTAYKILRKKNKAPFSAFIKVNNNDAILSASPERFIKVDNHCVETKPIKGTAKRFEDPVLDKASANELLNSEKNNAENVMIVDLLRNDLSKSCIAGSVIVSKLCALESFTNVHHLVSTIHGKLSENNTTIDVLKNCFPGGSITGAPKIAAMKIIEALEPHQRSLYCGSIFYIDASHKMDSNIAIRTALCNENNIHCYAGGGIVYDSVCEAEYEECLAKVGNILQILSDI
ncbi:MAG: aminodeoxychorismate synthase component I [Coxiellaceae bacterium]|nr:aminodeoxychorismate synthase component I [Coxiellaceae bacterium]